MRVLPVLLILLASASGISAQTIHGRVYDPATGAPISTAFVLLLDGSGDRVAGTLSRNDGRFTHRAPRPGEYRLRVERIGYETVTSPILSVSAGETLRYSMAVSSKAIVIEGVLAEGERECRIRPEEGLRTYALWEEARKALSVAAWMEAAGGAPFLAVIYERARELNSLQILEEVSRQTRSGYGQTAFTSVSAAELARDGYVQQLPNNIHLYYGLDAKGLLSDAFLDTHCFRIESANQPEEAGRIGLAFEPVDDRSQPDIAGVLWLDSETAELEYVEFTYTKHLHPMAIPTAHFGGRIEFRRLENGARIVDSWWIRMPQVIRRRLSDKFLSLSERTYNLRIIEVGGDVVSMTAPAAESAGGTARLEGSVYDRVLGKPLAHATVFVTGTSRAAVSDSSGRFEIDGLPADDYEVVFFHPLMDSLRITAAPLKVALTGDQQLTIELAVPDVPRCPASTGVGATGTLVGFVRNGLTGEPVQGARITVEDRDGGPRTAATGRYLVCGLPLGEPLQVNATHGGQGSAAAVVTFSEPGIMQRDLALLPAASIVAGPIRERAAAERQYPPLPLSGAVSEPTVQGRLLDLSNDDPIGGATVTLIGLDGKSVGGTLTDGEGAFVITTARPGRFQLKAARIGYTNVTSPAFDLRDDELLNVELRSSVGAVPLAPLTITVDRPPLVNSIRLVTRGFVERREYWGAEGSGFGHFLTREEIRKRGPFYLTDVLRGIPGVHVQAAGGRLVDVVLRGGCEPTIYLDGAIVRIWDPRRPIGTQLNELISPQDLAGIEVYPGSTRPGAFTAMGEGGGKACGSIVFWTG